MSREMVERGVRLKGGIYETKGPCTQAIFGTRNRGAARFFPEIAEKVRESVSTVFSKNVGVLAT